MEYILRKDNGAYMAYTVTKSIKWVGELEAAHRFATPADARHIRKSAPKKLSGFHVYGINEDGEITRVSRKNKRIRIPAEKRIEIYNKNQGCCALCGRKLDFEEMTVDHYVPLILGGTNDMDNLIPACELCNQLKAGIEPQIFSDRIAEMFMYQTGKRIGKGIRWNLIKILI